MLAFRVTQIELHRALQQKAGTPFLLEICSPEFSLVTQSSSARKHAKLNRRIPELDHNVTLGKQTAETCSNRQKREKCLRAFLYRSVFCRHRISPAPTPELAGARGDKTSRFRKVVVPIEPGSGGRLEVVENK
jgi:hypothetical protein